jgi:hypothetical protein
LAPDPNVLHISIVFDLLRFLLNPFFHELMVVATLVSSKPEHNASGVLGQTQQSWLE